MTDTYDPTAELAEVEAALDDPENFDVDFSELMDRRDALLGQKRQHDQRQAEVARQRAAAGRELRERLAALGDIPPEDATKVPAWSGERRLLEQELTEVERRAPFSGLDESAVTSEVDRLELALEDKRAELEAMSSERGADSARARLLERQVNEIGMQLLDARHEVKARASEVERREGFTGIAISAAEKQLADEDRWWLEQVRKSGTAVEIAQAEEEAARPLLERERGRELARYFLAAEEVRSTNRKRASVGLEPVENPAMPLSRTGAPLPGWERDRLAAEDPQALIDELQRTNVQITGDWVPGR